jgi:hypothetical protein
MRNFSFRSRTNPASRASGRPTFRRSSLTVEELESRTLLAGTPVLTGLTTLTAPARNLLLGPTAQASTLRVVTLLDPTVTGSSQNTAQAAANGATTTAGSQGANRFTVSFNESTLLLGNGRVVVDIVFSATVDVQNSVATTINGTVTTQAAVNANVAAAASSSANSTTGRTLTVTLVNETVRIVPVISVDSTLVTLFIAAQRSAAAVAGGVTAGQIVPRPFGPSPLTFIATPPAVDGPRGMGDALRGVLEDGDKERALPEPRMREPNRNEDGPSQPPPDAAKSPVAILPAATWWPQACDAVFMEQAQAAPITDAQPIEAVPVPEDFTAAPADTAALVLLAVTLGEQRIAAREEPAKRKWQLPGAR